jgi:hypothetical protein
MAADQRRAVAILEDYLRRIRMARPADAAQQYQIALLQQWTDHLTAVLEAEPSVSLETAERIVRGVIWGSTPQYAEAGLRTEMVTESARLLAERGVPRL